MYLWPSVFKYEQDSDTDYVNDLGNQPSEWSING